MGLFSAVFGTYSERQIKKIRKTVDRIEALDDEYSALDDDTLAGKTAIFKERLANGETLDDILPEAFATAREAAKRVLGKKPFRVQLMGGILLHQGRIAEMKTGEGKTLVATLPAYLNALSGEGVHIVTVNDYLARRDSEEMGRVYSFLGLTTGLIVPGQSNEEKHKAYDADITYATNNELGFDYLRDNMVLYRRDMVQRGHSFAIVDEVDSILIDEARTPLIISGQGDESSELYERAERLVRGMSRKVIKEMDEKEDHDDVAEDYIVDEKSRQAVLTANGIAKAEKFFGVENLSDPENSSLYHYIENAIRAHGVMKNEVDYVVKDGQVIIVDTFTGRLMFGRRYSNGLHQAIEAKEGVKIEKESKTLATITFQNYFRMYKKLSGMTGTALTEQDEFREIYRLDVVEVPTNKPMIRKDYGDNVYITRKAKLAAVVEQIAECHEKGQPVLVGTVSIDKSEELSKMLKAKGIPHNVLNAKHHDREAEIVAQAGKPGAVTIATNMAGRGTDIMLGGNAEYMAKAQMKKMGFSDELIAQANGFSHTEDEEILSARDTFNKLYEKYKEEIAPMAEEVRNAGGLFILGTERHESRRIDNQLRGRSGRQGDPGESRFYLSLEDDLIRLFGGDRIGMMAARFNLDPNSCIRSSLLTKSIETAQKRIESNNFGRRKNVLSYDDVMNHQRNIIYGQRREVIDGKDLTDKMHEMIRSFVSDSVDAFMSSGDEEWDISAIKAHFGYVFSDGELNDCRGISRDKIKDKLTAVAEDIYKSKDAIFGEVGADMREIERVILLRNVDRAWMEQIDAMDDLKGSIGLNSYAQRDPINEYRIVGAQMFEQMTEDIRDNTVRALMNVRPQARPIERVAVAKPTVEGFSDGKPVKKKPTVKKQKVGRNDPCPCGSGKKYKNCCLLKEKDNM
ncbi:MAG: preprotein translocase subunit SecA [Eubacteriales bacterium]|nr:preprotein translocase subunit SecA [Eubacteriales bacterium]